MPQPGDTMKLAITTAARRARREAGERRQAAAIEFQRAEALRRARNRSAVVAAALASVPQPRDAAGRVPAPRRTSGVPHV